MPPPSQQQFQIYLPGILRVLAESLYSNEKVAIRELIQNAHDSTARRRIEYKERTYQPRIEFTIDLEKSSLRICDNGTGLTRDEIDTYLSTIGRSYTRQLNEDVSVFSPNQAETLIGQFGMGFLSAFLIASEVRLTTRSIVSESPTIEWRSTGDIHYTTQFIQEQPVGTTVELMLKPSARYLLDREVLIHLIREYADFLDVPIHLTNLPKPINTRTPPWEDSEALEQYITKQLGEATPLYILTLHDHLLPAGDDQLHIPLHGFLYIPAASVTSILEYGDLTVFIRRMFVCVDKDSLLPSWARFVRGMIESSLLQPTASREQIQHDEGFNFVRLALAEQLTAGLHRIAEHNPFTWRQIVRGHRNLIIGWALRANELFAHVADIIPFRTSRGMLTLPEYLALTERIIYYTVEITGGLQRQLIYEDNEHPAIDASNYVESDFLKKYAAFYPEIKIVRLDDEAISLSSTSTDTTFLSLISFYEKIGINAQIAHFLPAEIPAVITFPADAEFYRDAHAMLDAGDLPPVYSDVVNEYLQRMDETMLSGTLFLNAENPLIQTLSTIPDEVQCAVGLRTIYLVARLLNGRMMNTSEVTGLFHVMNATWLNLLDKD